jgi:hypothetical protein
MFPSRSLLLVAGIFWAVSVTTSSGLFKLPPPGRPPVAVDAYLDASLQFGKCMDEKTMVKHASPKILEMQLRQCAGLEKYKDAQFVKFISKVLDQNLTDNQKKHVVFEVESYIETYGIDRFLVGSYSSAWDIRDCINDRTDEHVDCTASHTTITRQN